MLSGRIDFVSVIKLALNQKLFEISVEGSALAFLDRVGVEFDGAFDAASLLGFLDPAVIALYPKLAQPIRGSNGKGVDELYEVLARLFEKLCEYL